MTRNLFVAVCLALVASGCGKDSGQSTGSGASSNNAASSGNPLTAPVDYLGAVGAAQKKAEHVVDLTTLQRAVQTFVAGEERLPASLQELVTEGYLPKLPDVPRGMGFHYDPTSGRVSLVPLPPGVPRNP